jgi:CheY-like chemotaxis protein
MVDFKAALNATLLIVDDDASQLELRTLMLKMSGFDVLSAANPLDAIAILAQQSPGSVNLAVLDYEMPGINGCVLADYIKTRYPELRIVLYSARVDIPEREMGNVDCFVSKGEGIGRLLEEVSWLSRSSDPATDAVNGERPGQRRSTL